MIDGEGHVSKDRAPVLENCDHFVLNSSMRGTICPDLEKRTGKSGVTFSYPNVPERKASSEANALLASWRHTDRKAGIEAAAPRTPWYKGYSKHELSSQAGRKEEAAGAPGPALRKLITIIAVFFCALFSVGFVMRIPNAHQYPYQ